jgi:hypothetical protein
MFFQCPINPCFIVPAIIIATNVIKANAPVTAKFPVIVALPPGKNSRKGIKPKKFEKSIKRKKVAIRGVHRVA